ncbi:OmpA family protein [Pseudomonas sp. NPDC008258]|uniref:OmpA family protein n=1 Tax=Pseudomonas sp. NPDC008258 TaxID=3364418 RepID=UPI0036DFA8BD
MTALFEMRVRLGGDPQGFDETRALRQELVKLNHPACPDVDWGRVENVCLRLFELNGAELQTAVALVMARSYRHGLAGMSEGLALIAALLDQWQGLWPAQVSARLDLLSELFARLQPILRVAQWSPANLSALKYLAIELGRLEHQLISLVPVPLATLHALRSHVEHVLQQTAGVQASSIALPILGQAVDTSYVASPPWHSPAYTFVIEPQPRRRTGVWWLLTLVVCMALAGGWAWQLWIAERSRQVPLPQPVQLDSLNLFDAGSAELRPGSTKLLVNALVDIKARPGWLIIIAGHADPSGDFDNNLALSHARASAVREWMQAMGDLPDSCFAVQGHAANQPLASNETLAGRAENRRVDIRLVPEAGACAELESLVTPASPS